MGLIIGTFALAFVVLLAFAAIIAHMPRDWRRLAFAGAFAALLTPSWAPATIVAVPMPFGVMLAVSVFGGFPQELASLVGKFWLWHLIAFPVMFLLGYLGGSLLYGRNNDAPAA